MKIVWDILGVHSENEVFAFWQFARKATPGVKAHEDWMANSGFFEEFKIARNTENEATFFT